MTIRTLDFLPNIFKSDANRKFLNATLDQLVTEPNLKKINGYVGRKFAPTYKVGDNYLLEDTADRRNYQLEPCVVSSTVSGDINSFSSYLDLIQQIQHYGGSVKNHSRLFSGETYSFDGLVDFDKLVNFSQYYWIPNGPDAVDVFIGQVDDTHDYTVTRDTELNSYTISGFGTQQNPDIILARGGVYNFVVDQLGDKFWIQTDPGISGTRLNRSNINTRDVYGVVNNGTDNGIITFNVPQIDEQDSFVSMPLVKMVDFASTLKFNDVDNHLLQTLIDQHGGIDGVRSELAGKYIVFVTNDISDSSWEEEGVYALNGYSENTFDEGTLISNENRFDVWQIQLTDTGDGDQLINLSWVQDIPVESKVFIKSGTTFSNKEFYKNNVGALVEVPLITAPLDVLYYNDGVDQRYYGRIKIVDNTLNSIDIVNDILGNKQYTSPNGIVFTNGLKVRFGTAVSPSEYADKEYFVEGVGKSIRLISIDNLITPESANNVSTIPFDIYGFSDDFFDQNLNGPLTPDYITINRSSIDGNAWSRSNRWVHSDVINATAAYNDIVPYFDQTLRAARPIIEFNADLQLFNYGRIARHGVDVLDFSVTDALNEVEGSVNSYFTTAQFKDGMTVIFANDIDPTVRNKIFLVNVLDINGTTKVHLSEITDGGIANSDSVVASAGLTVKLDPWTGDSDLMFNPSVRKMSSNNGIDIIPLSGVLSDTIGLITGESFWFNGSTWIRAQKKDSVNIPPLFDVIDDNNNSFGDKTIYVNSSFTGCELFSYKPGSGSNDTVLGFPLSYRNFNNIGDIEFINHFDVMTFTELVNKTTITHKVNTGFAATIVSKDSVTKTSTWKTNSEKSKQYQIFSNVCDGITSYYEIDILPESITSVPNIKVYVNNTELTTAEFEIVSVGARIAVHVIPKIVLNDRVDILIYSKDVSSIGYYQIPQNFDFNALNQPFTSLTLGQFRNHLVTLRSNSDKVIGQVPGSSNLRDLDIKSQGGSILQHSAPTVYGSIFLLEKPVNFIDSITYAQHEYAKFKNRFLESFPLVINAGITTASAGVDYILQQLNSTKNNTSPWYYSDMVPYDQNQTTIEYSVLSTEIVEYEIDTIFNDSELGNKAVLVYLNGTQLIKGTEYEFNQTRPSVKFNISLNFDDVIQIRTYHNTDGCYIPETPTKLGMYPKFMPTVYLDSTYRTAVSMIRGHDGSLTPAFGDMRDLLLLELEKRIYNNIKIEYDQASFDINSIIPGKFRNTEYSKAEYDQIVSRCFLKWIGSNRVDYSTNEWFKSNDPWSWTYKKFKDIITGEFLPGYWRGIFKFFYDTDAPNERPWECLGFSEQPSWWIDTYGPAPYTGGNLVLWADLEQGIIRSGVRAGTYAEYARPGLSKIIPVSVTGELRSPEEFLVTDFNSADASGSFAIGDQGPVESAWRNSSDYPFAIQQALCLMKPALYFSQLASIQNYSEHAELLQFVESTTKQRITPSDFIINGATARNAGYLNWIVDYIKSNGSNPESVIHGYLDDLEVRLGYKVAGFTDKAYLKVLAEQSSPSSTNDSIIIPDENYKVHLHKSTPVDRVIYSAVIVEKTVAGFTVSGYNIENPFFTIIPSEPNSNQRSIQVTGVTGVIYNDYQRVKVTVPYGYEFKNKQQVVDFLISYQRYLQSQGFLFDDFNQSLQEMNNWELSAKEFLTWTNQGWQPGNILVLSPVSNSLKLNYASSVVDQIDNLPSGSKILDFGFNVVRPNLFNVVREGADFEITTVPEISIGLLDITLVQYEHALVFDNTTLFNDIIYKPELGNRQYRLKLIGNKTAAWDGQISPAGFVYSKPSFNNWSSGQDYRKGDIVSYKSLIYTALQDIDAADTFSFGSWKQIDKSAIKTGLLPNFAYNAKKFENMYDVDNQVADQNINKFSNGLIGYRPRSYLTDLSLNDTTQAKFYQGYIRDKGTNNAVTALATATFNNLSGSLEFSEEWALRVGEYGATESNQFVEVQLSDSKYTFNPISLSLLDAGKTSGFVDIIPEYKETLYKKPITFKSAIFANRDNTSIYESDIETAGYVNLNDIDATVFDIRNYTDMKPLVSAIHSGYKIWVAKDITRDWNVYRIDETPILLETVRNGLDTFAYFDMSLPHNLSVNDIFAIRNFSTNVDGFYKVERVDDINTVFVSVLSALQTDLVTTPTLEGVGIVFKLRSLRLDKLTDITSYTPINGWKLSDKIWVDNDLSDWEVYSKIEPWTMANVLPGAEEVSASHYGQQVALSPDGRIVVATAPGDVKDNVKLLVKIASGEFVESSGISIPNTPSVIVGNTLAMNQTTIVVSAENSSTSINNLLLYVLSGSFVTDEYSIATPTTAAGNFGAAIAISQDDNWLYVSSPSENNVYAYKKNTVSNRFELNSTIAGPTAAGYGKSLTTNKDGSKLVVGAPQATVSGILGAGAAYFYQRTGSLFVSPSARIETPHTTLGGKFGYSVCLTNDGSELLIGAPNVNFNNYKHGIVYRYKFVDLSVTGYVLSQEIRKPYQFDEHFGTAISTNENTSAILISSQGAYSLNDTVIDSQTLTLDGAATTIIDSVRDSGAVYVYDLLGTDSQSYVFNQQLGDAVISTGDNFGASVAINKGIAIVGSPLNDYRDSDAGKVIWFENIEFASGWSLLRNQKPTVDLDNVTRLYLYNRKTETVLANLDHIDPAKGKILGVADQDITYKTSFDPAVYNVGTASNIAVDPSFCWGNAQVGQVWWNIDSVRYIDYEQDSLSYRNKNWGRLFPGAVIEVLEWVESSIPPIQYTTDGIPKYDNNGAYVQSTRVDESTGIIQTKYYFWVKNKTTVDSSLSFRRLSVSSITDLIESPSTQGIPYAAIIQDNTISLFSSTGYISSSDTILHIDYALIQNSNIIHNEYELVKENSTSELPTKIINKLIDSLAGADSFGNMVPDYTLGAAERYGITIRPRQTMFVDRLAATKNFVQYVNNIFAQYPIVEEFDLSQLYLYEAMPTDVSITVSNLLERSYLDTALLSTGQQILVENDSSFNNQWAIYEIQSDKSYKVVKTQSYDTTDYWSKVDWFDSTYDPTIKPTYTVDTIKDIAKLTLKHRDTVRVKNNGEGRFTVFLVLADLSLSTIGVQEGTIKLSDALWAHDTNQIGFDNDSFDTVKYDLNPTVEFRNIINAIKDDIFIKTLDGEFNKLFFVILNFVLSEQRMVDWAFKTSFISILHKLRKLDQFPNYIKDNQTFYEDYINEVKPYRTKIREYVIDYEGSDQSNIHPTDFDLPSYYDTDFGVWRSPNGEHARDAVLLSTDIKYADWAANNTYSIESVQVTVGGYGYSSPPLLVVEGGGGSGTVLEAVIDYYLGGLLKVNVIKSGTGFTSQPTIRILGDGVDEAGNQTAQCYPMLVNKTMRSFDSTLKFDRVTYTSSVKQWAVNTTYNEGDIVSYNSKAYSVNSTITTSTVFVPGNYTLVNDSLLENAADRAMALYTPTVGMTPKELARLFHGTEYPGNVIDGGKDNDLEADTNIQSFYSDLELGSRPEDINITGGAYIDTFSSHAPEELLPGIIFDTLDIKVFTVDPTDPTNNPMGYRISKTMANEITNPDSAWEFRRISADASTTLSRDLNIDDEVIYVVDVSKLPVPGTHLTRPGIVYINGEKITYYTIDFEHNALGQIRRGVWGTGAPTKHIIGSLVVDAGIDQTIPGNASNSSWMPVGASSPLDGFGLRYAGTNGTTEQAAFIYQQSSYLPWLPGETGIRVDPNANHTRFDDDGLDEYLTPAHPYDKDPFDSYDIG